MCHFGGFHQALMIPKSSFDIDSMNNLIIFKKSMIRNMFISELCLNILLDNFIRPVVPVVPKTAAWMI